MLTDGLRVVGVQGSKGNYRARVTVDASGRRHWLAGRLGLRIRRHSRRLVAHYGYAAGTQPDLDGVPSLTADATGWTWAARIDDGLYHWTRLDVASAGTSGVAVPREMRGLRRLGPTRAADVTWRVVDPAAGEGYVLAGEAAAVLDPASSHGVLRALMTGLTSAAVAAVSLAGATAARDAARRYHAWLLGWFRWDAAALAARYRQAAWI